MDYLTFSTPLRGIPRVGPAFALRLDAMGLHTVEDLLLYYPFRYEVYVTDGSPDRMLVGSLISVQGYFTSVKNIFTRSGKKMTRGEFIHPNGMLHVIWFNQPYLVKSVPLNTQVQLSGKISEFGREIALLSPKYSRTIVPTTPAISGSIVHDSIIPIYSESQGITSSWIKERIAYVLDSIKEFPPDFLPDSIRVARNFHSLQQQLIAIHRPKNESEYKLAIQRLAYEEILLTQLHALRTRHQWKSSTLQERLDIDSIRSSIASFIAQLPFELTDAQHNVLSDTLSDMSLNEPMNRLIEGDVGSGKTIVAAVALYACYLVGKKGLCMAPTQILALQHYRNFEKLFESFGIRIGFVGGAQKTVNYQEYDIIVGTHALLHAHEIPHVALIVIDEQHRFGVNQRTLLRTKHHSSHVLSMTATPIPRTLALTLYGDLDLSVINQMPKGRLPIKTWVVPESKRSSSYDWIKKQINETNSAVFIVCPFIDVSESDESIKSVLVEYETLHKKIFTAFRVGLLHGKIPAEERDALLESLRMRQLDILVCTPIVEVGIDIPHASIIMIESAERFGLAQLHQLRGRVGRGGQQGYCLLFSSKDNGQDSERLKALETHSSGLDLAEIDLKMRGSGNLFGVQQSGAQFFKFANLFDSELISQAQLDARKILDEDPGLVKYAGLATRLRQYETAIDAN